MVIEVQCQVGATVLGDGEVHIIWTEAVATDTSNSQYPCRDSLLLTDSECYRANGARNYHDSFNIMHQTTIHTFYIKRCAISPRDIP